MAGSGRYRATRSPGSSVPYRELAKERADIEALLVKLVPAWSVTSGLGLRCSA
jgi:hypothetical protein